MEKEAAGGADVVKSFKMYGLTSQIRRACSSIPTNIAEGCGRYGDAELSRLLVIAMGSASEVEYLLQLAYDLGYLKDEMYQNLSNDVLEIEQMISGFLTRIKSDKR